METKRTAESQEPSRGVLRLDLSHDRQKGGERRWSAAGGKTIIETRQRRGFDRTDDTNPTENGQGGSDRDIRGAHLPIGKGTRQADMTAHCAVMMKALMERMTDGEDGSNEEQHNQQGGESRSWQASIAG